MHNIYIYINIKYKLPSSMGKKPFCSGHLNLIGPVVVGGRVVCVVGVAWVVVVVVDVIGVVVDVVVVEGVIVVEVDVVVGMGVGVGGGALQAAISPR